MINGFLKGKTALVTGATRNIGRGTAQMLAQQGANVVVHFNGEKSRDEAEQTAALVEEAGAQALLISADLTETKQLQEMFQASLERFGSLDILINNAGMIVKKALADISEEEYDRIFDINAKAPFLLMREAAVKMSDGGRIINIGTSILGCVFPHYSVYAASKAALEHFTRALGKELFARQITVNTIAPGALDTSFFYPAESPESIAMIKQFTGGLGKIEDVVPLIEFLVSPGARWVTAQTIFVNGGFVTR